MFLRSSFGCRHVHGEEVSRFHVAFLATNQGPLACGVDVERAPFRVTSYCCGGMFGADRSRDGEP